MRAVISLANNRGNYIKGLARLGESLRDNFNGDFLGFINERSIGSLLHLENPYAFKVYAFSKAIELGYSQIMWLDASVYAVGNIDHLFDEIEEKGFIMQEAGHYVGTWTNDKTLQHFGVKRDEAMSMPMIGNAGMLGLNFEQSKVRDFFTLWEHSMLADCFIGSWENSMKTESKDARCKGHRHDMSCSSIIANQMGLNHLFKRGDEILQYGPPDAPVINDTIVLKASGL